jgi:hypothetical protein
MGQTRSLLAGVALVLAGCVSATAPDDSARRHVVELEEENAELHAERDALDRRFGAVMETVYQPSIEGLVVEVNPERQLVVIDKGAQHEVEVGFVFTVYSGTTFKGLVRITDVREEMSSGAIFGEKNPIARGDSATTTL